MNSWFCFFMYLLGIMYPFTVINLVVFQTYMYLHFYIIIKQCVIFILIWWETKIRKSCLTTKLGAQINLHFTWGLKAQSFWLYSSFVSLGNLHYVTHDSMQKDPLPWMQFKKTLSVLFIPFSVFFRQLECLFFFSPCCREITYYLYLTE